MCLAIPGRVVSQVEGYAGHLVRVDVGGEVDTVNIGMLDEPLPGPGDWVLIHMGFALERIDASRAADAMRALEMMGRGRDIDS